AENNFTEVAAGKQLALAKADDKLVAGNWSYDFQDKNLNVPMFTIQGKSYTVGDFYKFVQSKQQPRQNISATHAMQLMYDNFVETSLIDYEKANLENKYIDYKMLVREYRDGILLFQLMDEKVWSKAIEDTTGLKAFFEANRENYKWDTRANATIISAANKEVLTKAQDMLKADRYVATKNTPADVLFPVNSANLTKAA